MGAAKTAEHLLETWLPKATSIQAALPTVLAMATANFKERLPWDMIFGFNLAGGTSMGGLACYSARPHVDEPFQPWTALWILQAAPDHAVWVADHVPINRDSTTRRPLKSPHSSARLIPGEIVLFCSSRTHWVDRPATKTLMLCVTLDFHTKPSRDDVERDLMGKLAKVAAAEAQDQHRSLNSKVAA